jgi:nucleoid DNA-binding protein
MVLSKATIVEALFAKHIFTRTQSAQTMDTLSEMIEKSLQEELNYRAARKKPNVSGSKP